MTAGEPLTDASGRDATGEEAAARWYRVAGPLFIEPDGRMEDGLEVVLTAHHSVSIPAATESRAREGAALPLERLGANALLDCRWDATARALKGTPAIVSRRSRLGRETRETLAQGFFTSPPALLEAGRLPKDPVDWRRPAAAAAKGFLGFLFLLLVVGALAA
ncbi:hypothetical protein [Sutterella sp.]|uniref:hypothetical protein n=1 Tax=Sutterella sp. TaxID=1981025 RepID=UPI003FD828B6